MSRRSGIHVIPNKNGGKKWLVAIDGKSKKEFDTQAKATTFGTRIAKAEKKELIIHGLNGQIKQKNSFGNDPYPPRG